MPFSYHSHSGQFCRHAENLLEEVVQTAVRKQMDLYALTEHMPREEEDLYPEEIKLSYTAATLAKQFDDYFHEAQRLQKMYASAIKLLIGIEIDWIRHSSLGVIQGLLQKYPFDLFIGSVHHVHTIPIDYDGNMYFEAREKSGGTDEKLAEDYFDLQYEMLKALKPPVVGHFDLIRLLSDEPESSFVQWALVWQKILRNLDFIVDYGGLVELNSAGLRKGMSEPYPKAEICKEFFDRGGAFTLSDDSHGIKQVGTNYGRCLSFAEEAGITSITILEKGVATRDSRFPGITTNVVSLMELKEHPSFFYLEGF
ncbi:MAG: histidinolphosphatase [Alectoria fallacina]|uniref:Histidinol-phosphatase n=1 Tax=Alectoria fallacina TaxID=1903189 RepID=A0A8H3I4G2_9LECA|nr:MAG: histidinolphosphatase [Alectoria fallacina]